MRNYEFAYNILMQFVVFSWVSLEFSLASRKWKKCNKLSFNKMKTLVIFFIVASCAFTGIKIAVINFQWSAIPNLIFLLFSIYNFVEWLDAVAKNQLSWNGKTNCIRKFYWIETIYRFLLSGQESQLRMIIDSGNNVNARDSDGMGIMHLAAINGTEQIQLKVA